MPRLLPATSTCILNTRVVSQRYTGVPSSDRGTVGVELGKRLRSEMKTDKEYETEHTFMESAYTSCCDNVLVATDPHSLILHVNEQLEPYTPNRPIPHEDETALDCGTGATQGRCSSSRKSSRSGAEKSRRGEQAKSPQTPRLKGVASSHRVHWTTADVFGDSLPTVGLTTFLKDNFDDAWLAML